MHADHCRSSLFLTCCSQPATYTPPSLLAASLLVCLLLLHHPLPRDTIALPRTDHRLAKDMHDKNDSSSRSSGVAAVRQAVLQYQYVRRGAGVLVL